MAIAVAQEAFVESGAGSSTTQTISITPTAGSTILVFVGQTDAGSGVAGTVTCSDNVQGSYGAALQDITQNTTEARSLCWALANNTGGARTITVTWAVAVFFGVLNVVEISGAATTSPIITSAAQAQNVGTTAADAVSSGAVSVGTAPALIFGWCFDWFSHNTVHGTGFTAGVTSTNDISVTENKRITSTGSNAATFTFSASPDVTTTHMVAVKEATAAAAGVPYRRPALPPQEEDAPPVARRVLRIPPAPAASVFVPYRRQPPQQSDEPQYLYMGMRSATIQSGTVTPDNPPLGWPRRVLALFQQTDDDQPVQRRARVTASGPVVTPDNPPWGWPRRMAMLASRPDEDVQAQQRRATVPIAPPVVVPDNPPWGWPRRMAMLATLAADDAPAPQPRRTTLPVSGPALPDSPPVGWPRRVVLLYALAAEELAAPVQRRSVLTASGVPPQTLRPPFRAIVASQQLTVTADT